MKILSSEVDATRLTIRTDRGLIAVEPRTDRMVRVRYTLEDELSRKPSLTVTPDAAGAPPPAFRVEERPETLVLSTKALSIEIDPRTAAFTYRDPTGFVLTREPRQGGKNLDPVDVLVSVFDDAATVVRHENADGARIDAVN